MGNNEDWQKFLNPQLLKINLVQAGLFIVAYEMFKSAVVEKVKGFFTFEYRRNDRTLDMKGIPSADYSDKVLTLSPNDEFSACCCWFAKMDALTQSEVDTISSIRRHRNEVAHELHKILFTADRQINQELLIELVRIKKKLDIWWVREIEYDVNPDFDNIAFDSVDWDNVAALDTIILSIVLSIFSGDDEYLATLHREFTDYWQKKQGTDRHHRNP